MTYEKWFQDNNIQADIREITQIGNEYTYSVKGHGYASDSYTGAVLHIISLWHETEKHVISAEKLLTK